MKSITQLVFFYAIFLISRNVAGQTVLFSENFDQIDAGTIPQGWVATPDSGWVVDSTNSSSGYTGASGLHNIKIDNNSPTNVYTVVTSNISTIGYKDISVIYGVRRTTHFPDSGSSIQSFDWSNDDGSTWYNIPYIENANNSTWSLINDSAKMVLSSTADNQSAIQLRWVANIINSTSGTYRIDDITVTGTPITSAVNDISVNDVVLLPNPASDIVMVHSNFSRNSIAHIYDCLGQEVFSQVLTSGDSKIDVKNLTTGIYYILISDAFGRTMAGKELLKD